MHPDLEVELGPEMTQSVRQAYQWVQENPDRVPPAGPLKRFDSIDDALNAGAVSREMADFAKKMLEVGKD